MTELTDLVGRRTSSSQSAALPTTLAPAMQSPKLALSLPKKKRDNHPKPFIALSPAGWLAGLPCVPVRPLHLTQGKKNLRPEFLPLSLSFPPPSSTRTTPLHHHQPPSLGKVVVDNPFFLFDLVLQVSLVESLHSISPFPPRPSRPPSIASERAQVKGLPKRPHPPNGSHPVRPSRPESTRSGKNSPALLVFTLLLDCDPASATSQGHFTPTPLGQVGFDLHFNRSDSLRDWFTAAPFSS